MQVSNDTLTLICVLRVLYSGSVNALIQVGELYTQGAHASCSTLHSLAESFPKVDIVNLGLQKVKEH